MKHMAPSGKIFSPFRFAVCWPLAGLTLGFWLPVVIWVIRYADARGLLAVALDTSFRALMVQTVLVAAATAIASTAFAYPLALFSWLSNDKVATRLAVIALLPVIVGLLARNYSWIGMFSGGDLLSSLGLSMIAAESHLYTPKAVVLVMTYIFLPIAFFVLLHAFSSVTAHEVDAARTLGADDFEIIQKVVMPHTFRQATMGASLIFANAVGYFVTPRMLGGGTFDMAGNLIWRYAVEQGDFPRASSLSLSFLVALSPFYIVSSAIIIRNRKRILGR